MKPSTSTVVETRVDVRVLAALCRYFVEKGSTPGTMSGLVSLSIDALHQLLLHNEKIKPIASFNDALLILSSQNIKLGKKSRRSLVKALELEDITLDEKGESTEIEKEAESIMELME